LIVTKLGTHLFYPVHEKTYVPAVLSVAHVYHQGIFRHFKEALIVRVEITVFDWVSRPVLIRLQNFHDMIRPLEVQKASRGTEIKGKKVTDSAAEVKEILNIKVGLNDPRLNKENPRVIHTSMS
jgi:hypothetical protein